MSSEGIYESFISAKYKDLLHLMMLYTLKTSGNNISCTTQRVGEKGIFHGFSKTGQVCLAALPFYPLFLYLYKKFIFRLSSIFF